MKDFFASPAKVLGTLSAILWIGLIIGTAMTYLWPMSIIFALAGFFTIYIIYDLDFKNKR